MLRLELERSHQNIYGNTGDSNQLWERKVFMSVKLDRFNNIKGFLHPDEGKFLYELSSILLDASAELSSTGITVSTRSNFFMLLIKRG